MTCKARDTLFVLSLAASIVLLDSPSGVHANRLVEPVHCRADLPCMCEPAQSQVALKYWICQKDAMSSSASIVMDKRNTLKRWSP